MLELTQRNPLPAWFEFSFGARLGCRDLERRELGAARYRHHRRSPKEERTGVEQALWVLPFSGSNCAAMWQKLYALRLGCASHSCIPRVSCAALATDAEIPTSRHIQASVDISDKERCRGLRSSPISQAETLKLVRFQLSLAAIF